MEPLSVRHIPPCPFCGNKLAPQIFMEGPSFKQTTHRYVYCDPYAGHGGCGASGPPVYFSEDLTDTITRCVELWSRRV